MKFSIFLSVMLVAGATLASSVESAATFGVLKITSTNTETVVSVPWEAAGGGAVKVKDFVKTTNMTAGDELFLYVTSSQTYKHWVLNGSGEWVGSKTITSKGGVDVSEGDDGEEDDTLARGDALIICRQNYNSGATPADSIYLYGQYNSTGVTEYEMAYHASVDKATLFAPVPVGSIGEGINLNYDDSLAAGAKYLTWTNVGSADQITIQDEDGNAVPLYWNGNKWGVYNPFPLDNPVGWQDNFIIKPGMGAWYYAAAVDRTGKTIDRTGAPTARLYTK